jgi:probable phosphoglycerate mutase
VRGWGRDSAASPTRLILIRHGETAQTVEKRFSGTGGADPGLTDLGRDQARAAASYVALAGGADALLSSPMRRSRETAEMIGAELGLESVVSDDWRECAFGEWDGRTFAEVQRNWPDELDAWLGSTAVAPPDGESFDACADRVHRARDAALAAYPGKVVVVVTHVTPIKLVVRSVLEAPMEALFRMELRPGSVTGVHWYADGVASLRGFNVEPLLVSRTE